MASPDLAFQTTIYQALSVALLGTCDVEVSPEQNKALPYVRIGDSDVLDNPVGHEITAVILVFSDKEGSHEAKQIQEVIRTTLHSATFARDGWTFSCVRQDDARCLFDPNDENWQGIQRFRCLANQT